MTYRPENTLKERVTLLTTVFVTALMRSLRETSLEELLGNMPAEANTVEVAAKTMPRKHAKKPAKRTRRTASDIRATAAEIILFVGKNPNTGAESIRKALHIPKSGWLQPIALALASGLKKKGEKRATVYFVAKGAAKATAKKNKATKTTPKVVTKPRTKKPSMVAAGDASSPTPEPTETNGTSTQIEVHPVVTASPS